jgi:hypothetical protein
MENFEPKNEWADVAEKLFALQEKVNGGRGISCVRQVVDELRRGDIKGARMIADMDGDKLRSFPEIENFLEETIFVGVPDSRLKIRKRRQGEK